jgi:hypothetical protein
VLFSVLSYISINAFVIGIITYFRGKGKIKYVFFLYFTGNLVVSFNVLYSLFKTNNIEGICYEG